MNTLNNFTKKLYSAMVEVYTDDDLLDWITNLNKFNNDLMNFYYLRPNKVGIFQVKNFFIINFSYNVDHLFTVCIDQRDSVYNYSFILSKLNFQEDSKFCKQEHKLHKLVFQLFQFMFYNFPCEYLKFSTGFEYTYWFLSCFFPFGIFVSLRKFKSVDP